MSRLRARASEQRTGPAGDSLVGAVRRAAEHVVDKWILLRGDPVWQTEVRRPLSFVFLLGARLLTFRLRSQSRTWAIDIDMHARPASGELPRLAYCRFVAAPLDLSSTFALQLSTRACVRRRERTRARWDALINGIKELDRRARSRRAPQKELEREVRAREVRAGEVVQDERTRFLFSLRLSLQ